jgi:4-amino-4-deoxy-L-arabinose transferase-like glycosyltransferase|tara:strand:- start:152 stop:1726 length:1575 start_codon:yes stop_codon:yes gene_type:complete
LNIKLAKIIKMRVYLIVLAGIVSFAFLDAYPISILDEAKNAEAAREMLISGDYWVPKFNGELRTDKPPLHYYFMAIGFKLFGASVFGARFFSACMGLILLLATYRFAQDHMGEKVAKNTFFVLLSSFFFMQEFRLAVPDPYLITFVSLALFQFYNYYKKRKYIHLLLFYAFLSLATLSKGPVAIALPGLSVFLFLVLNGEFKRVFDFYPIMGLLCILTLTAPWFIQVHLLTDGLWTNGFFFQHNFDRFLSPMEGHGGIFLVTWGFVILGILPFSFFIPQSLRTAWQQRKNSTLLFALCIIIVFILFFSVSSTKLPNYTMPCYPFIALLLGYYIKQKQDMGIESWDLFSISLLSILAIALPIVVYFVLSQDQSLFTFKNLAFTFIPTVVGTLVGLIFFFQKKIKQLIYMLICSWGILVFIFNGFIFPSLTNTLPTTIVANKLTDKANIVVYKRMDAAFPFTFQSTFKVINTIDELRLYSGYYVLTNHPEGQSLDEQIGIKKIVDQKALFENHTSVLYYNDIQLDQ